MSPADTGAVGARVAQRARSTRDAVTARGRESGQGPQGTDSAHGSYGSHGLQGIPGSGDTHGPHGTQRAESGARGRSFAPDGRERRLLWTLGLFTSELVTTFRRGRTLVLLAVLASLPLLIGIAVKVETSDGGMVGDTGQGPPFLSQITNNGLFLVFTTLAAALPFLLPMAVGVIAGDAIAGEAGAGTLRYLLVVPAGRTRLLLAKFATVMAFCLVATLVVAASALAVGAVLFPVGEVTLISGTGVPYSEGLLRAAAIAVAVAASLVGLATMGLFISTLTGSGIAAMAGTVGGLIAVQILNSIPQLDTIHPYLFPNYWLSFADLLRAPVYWDELTRNFSLQALYAVVFGSAAWARFTTRDITA